MNEMLKIAALAIEELQRNIIEVRLHPNLTARERADAAKSYAEGIAAIVRALPAHVCSPREDDG